MLFYTPVLVLSLFLSQAATFVHLSIAPPPRVTQPMVETGLVLLDGKIDAKGKIDSLNVGQGMAPFVEQSLEAVRQWVFEVPTNSHEVLPISVVLLYRPKTDLPDRAYKFEVPVNPSQSDASPQVETIIDPGYPLDSAAEGTVILQLQIDDSGCVRKTDVIGSVSSLTQAATDAVNEWTFRPAMHDGKPIAGVVIAAINFSRPALVY